ncbi:TetR/AcrR family transcriptional regulator [Pimelobacter sp. 30-1]|uniref:TetR/AcrR family transcriptional regulator n=1 Tax=Pimelobacter sp. 30-1 TaxID=2004991 RepID=UPI001C0504D8|nr:TetR/AcrR family transcriptional regulator [Pimelobacter sp. 30-1]MBU2697487.1 TetR family transcriptional regulator [Pimelobacter sp. 30-1]
MTETPGTSGSLTERRKAATQLEIARTAARLFTERGAAGTTAEAIAEASGIALRTFYRYSRTKEDAVAPLLSVGGDAWRAGLAATAPGTPLLAAVEAAVRASVASGDDDPGLPWVRGLLRAAADDAALAAVWYRVNLDSERQLRPILARLAPDTDPVDLALVAAAATDAIRLAFETWAESDEPQAPVELAVRCLRALTAGLV